MTGDQASWLQKNKPYQALPSRPASGTTYIKRGMLHADGTFELAQKGVRPKITQGCFEVGVRAEAQDLERR